MLHHFNFMTRACLCACVLFAATSCKDTDDFFTSKGNEDKTNTEAYDFDFSTKQEVDLYVEYKGFGYSASEPVGSVRFGIYGTNPVVNENTENQYVDESIKPIIELYTDERGKFDQTITLPAYAKVLHIVTGNLAIGFSHEQVQVVNHEAKLTVENDGSTMSVYNPRRAPGPGESVSEILGLLESTGYEVDSKGNATSVQIYQKWGTPLGTWNSATGRPDYLLDKTTVTTPGLVLTDKEVKEMYDEACNILPNNSGIDNSHYRTAADVTLKKASEVTLTALGSFTCWNTTLGYYYYNDDNKPTNRMDLNPIMLFPNTQDGKRYGDGNYYNNNIGMVRGDVIRLKYFPNITDPDPDKKYTEASNVFPKGTKIGFIIRTNGWGMMGDKYCTKTYNKKMNIWATSTDGLAYANPKVEGKNKFTKPNDNGEARTAEFSYSLSDGTQYCILAFEDACDDYDYNDLIFSLNPANVFLGLHEVEKDKSTEFGVYAFEDRWPAHSDYDMNDIMVDCKHEMFFSDSYVKKEIYNLTTYQNIVADKSGLAVKMTYTKRPSSIVMKKVKPNSKDTTVVTFPEYYNLKDIYALTEDVKSEINTTYILELTYSDAQPIKNLVEIEPFIYGIRENKDEELTQWEVHLPNKKPTSVMDLSYFCTHQDASNFSKGKFFVSSNEYPFAFYLANAKAENFFNTTLVRANESKSISSFYPKFLNWATSKGAEDADWYLYPAQ